MSAIRIECKLVCSTLCWPCFETESIVGYVKKSPISNNKTTVLSVLTVAEGARIGACIRSYDKTHCKIKTFKYGMIIITRIIYKWRTPMCLPFQFRPKSLAIFAPQCFLLLHHLENNTNTK